ncbi:glycosyltransferase involved in cell wall biosynthesis [Roseibium hamelinense]|uniref:Glycosyltransferase involved in cell wall biosynthesis n=1 Tax=Roseibium hamelinense TaxID=150831 RepID=A0A562T796_9HYPH|nr:glycosyltransferase family 4 protein [Roseibium hamelinense]MTI43751.1 glycosyltransferase [Roseibium hamelinense]TWI89437.1 glycosyltransferase involved in cell wall biosynthesis [Roseibium hamelinense]
MKIAFTAPMKPLDHPVPSGDRTMGRLIVKALEEAGHDVRIASSFRSWSMDGGEEAQTLLREQALAEAARISQIWDNEGYRPDVFLTYHLYHKAPDWIGPALADRFNLPYAIVEASRAPKRQAGDWAFGFAEADKALARADMVAAIHNADAECLEAVVEGERLRVLLPFIDSAPFEVAASQPKPLAAPPLKLLTVGMMRPGDKTRSYEVLARALQDLTDLPFQLTIVGDGDNRPDILKLFPPERITWLGARPIEELPALYATHDLFVWPAIREAFGLVFLEAQAAGLGVVAGDAFGVPDIVRDGETGLLSPEGDAAALGENLRAVLNAPARAEQLGHAARLHIAQHHRLQAGSQRLAAFLTSAITNHQAR